MAKAAPKTNTTTTQADGPTGPGKGRPTPSRREREAANRRPLVGATPADRKAARARLNQERDRARAGMANGEERYLAARDRGEQRRFVRDHIDARWNLGEVMLPIMFIVLLTSTVGGALANIAMLLIWAFVALFALDAFITWRILGRKLTAKFGSVQRGTFWYIVNRSFQMRFLRLPKPQVKRGEYPK
ncbi:DUF3043 domain-containing protein [Curtobacterium ammoniigenes]|uniref:DUF3043 domain-containing protein n=1 Tax=Curtobacterium ammoniigenes TaxID=395387 RepID=UPI00082F6FB0|nr:DUF3043 domain-containing protein [Curtobacterium ammoniigenes]